MENILREWCTETYMESKLKDNIIQKRFERKFAERLNNSYLFKKFLILRNFSKKYNQRVINSLYFDDLNFTSFKDNIDGNPRRFKIRIRWYDENIENLYLEIKNKYGFLGWKNTIKLSNINYLKKDLKNYSNSQLEKTLNKIFKKNVFPILKTKYLREYYENPYNNIRATIDTKLEFSSVRTYFNIKYDKEILEFKYPISKDKLFRECIISKNNFRFQKFSKYVVGINLLNRNLLIWINFF